MRLKMSASPKSRLQWYWGGRKGVSLMPSPALVRDSDQGARIRSLTSSNCQTREQDDTTKLVLEHRDEQWFCDNVVQWPSSCSRSPPGVIDKDVASSFRLWELRPSSTLHSDVAPDSPNPAFLQLKGLSTLGNKGLQHKRQAVGQWSWPRIAQGLALQRR